MKRVGFILLLLTEFAWMLHAQSSVDSLYCILSGSEKKSKIYNLLAESTLNDSINESMQCARNALHWAITENNLQQRGLALFNIGEAHAISYCADSAMYYYRQALDVFIKTDDRYNISYTYNNLGWINYEFGNFKEAIEYYGQSLAWLDPVKDAGDLSHLYLNLGNSYHQLGQYHTAVKYFRKSLALSVSSGDNHALPIACNGIGLAYKYLGVYDSALSYYKLMLDHDKVYGTDKDLAIDYQNIGSLFYQWGHFQKAEDYFLVAYEILNKEGRPHELASIINNVGMACMEQKKFDRALEYFNEALVLDMNTGIQVNMAIRYNNIGDVYFKTGEYILAEKYYKDALKINRNAGQKFNIATNLTNLGKISFEKRNFRAAIDYFINGLAIADSINTNNLRLTLYFLLSESYKTIGDFRKALDFKSLHAELQDSLFKVEGQARLADLSIQYDLDKKDKEIDLLNKQKELESVRASTYRNYMIHLSAGIVIVTILLLIVVRQYRSKREAYRNLVRKNLEAIKNDGPSSADTDDRFNGNQNRSENNGNVKLRNLYESLLDNLKTGKTYLNKEISIREVAEELGTNTHYLSEAINSFGRTNFNGLINDYRVREACRLLADPDNDNLTIEAISQQSGFHSKSAFNTAFKAFTGVTPSFYRRSAGNSG